MKKKYLLFLANLPLLVSAQNDRISFGIKAGPNLSNYISDLPFDFFKPKIGFYIGGFAEIKLSEKFCLQLEVMLTQNGAAVDTEIEVRQSIDEPSVLLRFKDRINDYTLAVPIRLRYHVNDIFSVDIGPQLGYVFLRKRIIKEDPIQQEEPPGYNFDEGSERFDFGLSLGIAFKVTNRLALSSNYYVGLKDINGSKSSVLQLGLDYTFL